MRIQVREIRKLKLAIPWHLLWLPGGRHTRPLRGFTLAELLIALAILGVIATFTIPKVLQAQTNSKYNAMAKEAAATISAGYQAYKLTNTVGSSFQPPMLTPYLNYVSLDTVNSVDHKQTWGGYSCTSPAPCLRLHNGGVLLPEWDMLGGTGSTNAVYFIFDPDGVNSLTTNGPGKSVEFALYYNGRLATAGTLLNNTVYLGSPTGPDPTMDPPWFSWN